MTVAACPAESCPACSGTSLGARSPYNGYEMLACRTCSLLFTRQRHFSGTLYDQLYHSDPTYVQKFGRPRYAWFKRRALRWMASLDTERRLFDVGCGTGTFLLLAKQAGWRVSGLEPAARPAEHARTMDLDVYCGLLPQFRELHHDRFGVVTCFEVLEHVADPVGMLRLMRSMLLPTGALIVSVPNLDDPYCLEQRFPITMPPVHINFFSRRSLRVAFERAGFRVRRMTSRPIPTGSVRAIFGNRGFVIRLPLLIASRVLGRADGTNLLAMAQP